MLNFHWILPALGIGGKIQESLYESVTQEHGITHVVDLRSETCDDVGRLIDLGVKFLHLPTPDHAAIPQKTISIGVNWVNLALREGGRVLVHCEHGIGRSALLVLCVLVSRGFTPLEALERAKSIRFQVSPSPEQIHALIEWSQSRVKEHQTIASWHELARVAYRHLEHR